MVNSMRSPGQAIDNYKERKAIEEHIESKDKEKLMPKLESFAEQLEKEQEKAKEETKGDEV